MIERSIDKTKGAVLLEVCVSLLLLAFATAWLTLLYSGVFFGSQTSDNTREALAAAEAIAEIWKDRARDSWPGQTDTSDADGIQSVPYGDYLYRVEDLGMVPIPDPLLSEEDETAPTFYEMKRLSVVVAYKDRSREGETVTKSVEVPAFVTP